MIWVSKELVCGELLMVWWSDGLLTNWYTEKYWSSDHLTVWGAGILKATDWLTIWEAGKLKTTDGLMVWWSDGLTNWYTEKYGWSDCLRNWYTENYWKTLMFWLSDRLWSRNFLILWKCLVLCLKITGNLKCWLAGPLLGWYWLINSYGLCNFWTAELKTTVMFWQSECMGTCWSENIWDVLTVCVTGGLISDQAVSESLTDCWSENVWECLKMSENVWSQTLRFFQFIRKFVKMLMWAVSNISKLPCAVQLGWCDKSWDEKFCVCLCSHITLLIKSVCINMSNTTINDHKCWHPVSFPFLISLPSSVSTDYHHLHLHEITSTIHTQ